MTVSLRANNDGTATVLVSGSPKMTLDTLGNIVGTLTPPPGDSSKKLATTEFVKGVGHSFSGAAVHNASTTTSIALTAADVNKFISVNADTSSVSVTLPPKTTVYPGAVIKVNFGGNGNDSSRRVRVYPSGAEQIFGGTDFSYTSSNPVVLGNGDYAEFVYNGFDWQLSDSTIMLDFGGAVTQGLNGDAGFRRLPGGTILQWGKGTYTGTQDVPMVVPFPNKMAAAFASPDPSISGSVEISEAYPKTAQSMVIACTVFQSGSFVSATLPVTWFTLGF